MVLYFTSFGVYHYYCLGGRVLFIFLTVLFLPYIFYALRAINYRILFSINFFYVVVLIKLFLVPLILFIRHELGYTSALRKVQLLIIIGLLRLLIKGQRFLFLILRLEIIAVGVMFYFLPVISEALFILLIVFCLFSRVMGLVFLVMALTTYGQDFVKY